MADETEDIKFDSWKEIAGYLARDKRTCQRWEKELGLPVRRLSAKSKARVYAYKAEIDDWLKKNSGDQKLQEESAFPALERKRLRTRVGLIAIALLLILGTVPIIFNATKKGPPHDFRIEGSRLIIIDGKGRELWDFDTKLPDLLGEAEFRTHFQTRNITADGTRYLLPWLIIDDLFEDGDPKVLFTPKTRSRINEGTLVCFNSKGAVDWKFEAGKTIKYGGKPFPRDCDVRGFYVADLNQDGFKEIVLDSNALQEYPNRVVVLDRKGLPLGEYWNAGQLSDFIIEDIDQDGRNEILLIGQNNEYRKTVLVVLDPSMIRGGSPQTDQTYLCKDLVQGTEKYYLLFPNSDLDIYPEIDLARLDYLQQGDFLELWTYPSGIIFQLGRSLELIDPRLSHGFEIKYNKRLAQGLLKTPYDPARIAKELKAGMRYWDGERWVSTTTKTKFWRDGGQVTK